MAGICRGLAEHLGWNVTWVRVGFVVATFCYGAGALFYIWCWIFAPKNRDSYTPSLGQRFDAHMNTGQYSPESWMSGESSAAPPNTHLKAPTAQATARPAPAIDFSSSWHFLLLAAFGVVTLIALSKFGVNVSLPRAVPLVIACSGVAMSWVRLKLVSISTAVVAISVAIVAIALAFVVFLRMNPDAGSIEMIIATLVAASLLAIAVVPWAAQLIKLSSDRKAQQAAAAAKVDVAAHLHDSVLQTLALIQQRSDPHSDVARLARHQEQSLRDWLVDSDQSANSSLKSLLSTAQDSLEAQYPVRFQLVTVGPDAHGVATDIAAAAAIEAMRNAAAHAGGDITVYSETSKSQILISVIDRGPGVNLDEIPANHFGIRESIIARAERAGGSAKFSPGPGGHGTKVEIVIPLSDSKDEK